MGNVDKDQERYLINNPEDEVLACFNKEDYPLFHTGKLEHLVYPVSRKEAHRKNIPHLITRVFAISTEGRYLVQRRSKQRKSHPGLFTDSASGHVRYVSPFTYENIEEDAWRELEEEMGTHVIYGRLFDIYLEEFRNGGCELSYIFIAVVEPSCRPDPLETGKGTGFYTKEELRYLLLTESFVKTSKKYWEALLEKCVLEDLLIEYYKQNGISKHCLKNLIKKNSTLKERVYSEDILETIDGNKKEGKIGALIGRFQPLHKGHLEFILHALSKVSFLKIGIGSSQYSHQLENPFTFEERKEMLLRALHDANISPDRYSIYAIPDRHNMHKWLQTIREVMGHFDVFFSNNEWTRQLLLKMGVRIAESKKFNFKRYNGSFIRERILKDLSVEEFLPPSVYNYLKEIKGLDRIKKLYRSINNRSDNNKESILEKQRSG